MGNCGSNSSKQGDAWSQYFDMSLRDSLKSQEVVIDKVRFTLCQSSLSMLWKVLGCRFSFCVYLRIICVHVFFAICRCNVDF